MYDVHVFSGYEHNPNASASDARDLGRPGTVIVLSIAATTAQSGVTTNGDHAMKHRIPVRLKATMQELAVGYEVGRGHRQGGDGDPYGQVYLSI